MQIKRTLTFIEEIAQAAVPPEVLATSAARKLAEQFGLKLAEIPGTGIGGRITEQDVLAFESQAKAPALTAAAPSALPAANIIPFAPGHCRAHGREPAQYGSTDHVDGSGRHRTGQAA